MYQWAMSPRLKISEYDKPKGIYWTYKAELAAMYLSECFVKKEVKKFKNFN